MRPSAASAVIVVQWARHLGATVIGVVGSDAKVATARAHGLPRGAGARPRRSADRVKESVGGHGAHVVYDFGRQGHVFRVARFAAPARLDGDVTAMRRARCRRSRRSNWRRRGSLFLTRPTLFSYITQRRDLLRICARALRRDRSRCRAHRDRPDLPAARRATGAPRPRSPSHDRLDRTAALSNSSIKPVDRWLRRAAAWRPAAGAVRVPMRERGRRRRQVAQVREALAKEARCMRGRPTFPPARSSKRRAP